MSYRCSRARREFESQINQAESELGALYKMAAKRGNSSRLLAAYYVFAFSQLEVYIKCFIEDALDTLNTSGETVEKLPDLMLGFLLHKGESLAANYRRYYFREDEGEILSKVAETTRKILSWNTTSATICGLDSADFLEKKKYPSPKNFPQLFRRLGIEKIWAVLGKAGKMNAELILTSLNDLRTDIAHEGKVPTGFSISDFKDRLNQMRRVVAALDRGVSSHFCHSVVSRAIWNRAMA